MSNYDYIKGSMVAIATPMLLDGEIDYELISKVDSLKKVIESGRAVRKKANIKVRQPLDHLKIFMLVKNNYWFFVYLET